MKRILSLILALMLIMSLAVTAFAETGEGDTSGGTGGENTGGNTTQVTYKTVSLRIQGTAPGHTYHAYQIFKGNVSSDKHVISNVQWGSGISDGDAFLAAMKADHTIIGNADDSTKTTTLAKEFANLTTATEVALDMSKWQSNRERIEYFAKFLYGYTGPEYNAAGEIIQASKTFDRYLAANPTATVTNTTGTTYTFENLEEGYYLIVDGSDYPTNKHDFYTNFIVALSANSDIAVKGTYPTVTKLVSNDLATGYSTTATNQMNLDHYYRLSGSVPTNIGDYSTYYYQFSDTLSAGLEYQGIEEIYIYRGDNTKVTLYTKTENNKAFTDAKFTVAYQRESDGTTTLTVTFNNLLAANMPSVDSSDTIIVEYAAKLSTERNNVTDDAGEVTGTTPKVVVGNGGNANTVVLNYSNNPNGNQHGTTVPAETLVYTFGLELTKVDAANHETKLNGAEFRLYHVHKETVNNTTVEHKMFAVVDNNGCIVNWVDESALNSVPSNQTTVLTTDNGQFKVYGLKEKIGYYLQEITPPTNYNLLGYDIPLQLTKYETTYVDATKTYEVSYMEYEVNKITNTLNGTDAKPGIMKVMVENKAGDTLPSTGGMGTTILYIAGSVLVLAAVVLLITKKRMADAE